MREKCGIRLGLAPIRRTAFSREDAVREKGRLEDVLAGRGIDYVNIDWLNEDGLLTSERDAPRVASFFREEGIEALFLPHVNFGSEAAAVRLAAAVDVPVLLWGPRDDAPLPDGIRTRDSQCGLFATSKGLRRMGVPFTYIVNSRVEDGVFGRGLEYFLRTAMTVRAMSGMRIGQVGPRPGAFWSVMCNEGELLERFGIQVVPLSLLELVARVRAILDERRDEVSRGVEEIRSRVDAIEVAGEEVEKLTALKIALLEWGGEEDLSAVALQCWSALQGAGGLGIMPCFAHGELAAEGLPVACETDINGAVTAALTQAAAGYTSPIFFADLTVRHPENDNAELLWHCGPFPHALKAEGSESRIDRHFGDGPPGIGDWEIRGGEISITRFDGDRGEYRMLMGEARGVEGPKNRGTYLWAEFSDWPRWEERFVYGPYIHHVVGIHAEVLPVLYEALKYIPGIEADLVDETPDSLRARWR